MVWVGCVVRKRPARRAEARHLQKRRASEPERPENENAPTESGRKFLHRKCTTTVVYCQGKSVGGKQNPRKPLDCWEITEVTLDFSFSREKIQTRYPPSERGNVPSVPIFPSPYSPYSPCFLSPCFYILRNRLRITGG